MKRILTSLSFILLMLPVFSQIDTCYSKFTSVAPVIDGINNDAAYFGWKMFKGTSGNDNTVYYTSAWDNNYLYIAVNVIDDTLVCHGGAEYGDDCVEIYIDGDNSHSPSFGPSDRQYRINYNKSTLSGMGDMTGVLHNWTLMSGGYSVEFAIPWSNLMISPGKLNFIDIGNVDDDYLDGQERQTFWSGNINNWCNNGSYGYLLCYTTTKNISNIQVTNLRSDYNILPGATLPLFWTSINTDSLDIECMINNNSIWVPVKRVAASSGHYNYTIPSLSTGSYMVFRFKNYIDNSVESYSSKITIASVTDRVLLRSNERFNIVALPSDHLSADTTIYSLTKNYYQIYDSIPAELIQPVTVDIYPDLATYHNAIGWSTAPDWVVGNAEGENAIKMVSPYNPGPTSNLSGMLSVIGHELTHCFVYRIAHGYPPIWLNEGTACYILATQDPSRNVLCHRIDLLGGKPTLDTLNTDAFADIDGYPFSQTIAQFISTHFSNEKLRDFIASNLDYSVLGYTDQMQFQNAWFQFLDDYYPCDLNVEDNDAAKNIVLYPNPAVDNLKIYFNDPNGKYDIKVYSVEGKLVSYLKNISGSDYDLSIKDLDNGLYLISVITDNSIFTSKFVKKQ